MTEEHKSAELEKIGEEHGWKTQVVPEFPEDFDSAPNVEEIVWHFYAMRGTETLHVVYRGDRMLEENVYTFGTYKRYPQRRVAIVALLTGKPDLSKTRDSTVVQKNKTVDWNDDTPAMDVMLAVLGKKITYVNRLSEKVEEAVINVNLNDPLSRRLFRVYYAPSGRRLLEWADPFGFRCVALEQIVSVA